MANNNNFKVGDVVQLKSGGPRMTVSDPRVQGNLVECRFWDEKGQKFGIDHFPPDMLQVAPDPAAGRGGFAL